MHPIAYRFTFPTMKKLLLTERWTFIPIIGITLFVVLYIVAAIYYPGGSNADREKEGFDWINNYWCDLLAKNAKNGVHNSGRMFALTGMVILFSSIAVFWYYLPPFFHERKRTILLIRYTGTLSMFTLIFIFTQFHDSVIGIGSTISAVPMAATLKELRKHQLKTLYFLGWFCIVLILLNFFIYITHRFIVFLPLLQKITLLFFLLWILIIAVKSLVISWGRKVIQNQVIEPV
jgi:hypothetical protein